MDIKKEAKIDAVIKTQEQRIETLKGSLKKERALLRQLIKTKETLTQYKIFED